MSPTTVYLFAFLVLFGIAVRFAECTDICKESHESLPGSDETCISPFEKEIKKIMSSKVIGGILEKLKDNTSSNGKKCSFSKVMEHLKILSPGLIFPGNLVLFIIEIFVE